MPERDVMEVIWSKMMEVDGQDFEFEIDRDVDVVERDGLDRTFSEEAMEHLNFQVMAWIGTRVMKAAQGGVMPQRLVVQVSVSTDLDGTDDVEPN